MIYSFDKRRSYLVTEVNAVQIPVESSKYVNLGCMVCGELTFFGINFIRNTHNWGCVLMNPDGESLMYVTDYDEDEFCMEIMCDDVLVSVVVMIDLQKNMYEVSFN